MEGVIQNTLDNRGGYLVWFPVIPDQHLNGKIIQEVGLAFNGNIVVKYWGDEFRDILSTKAALQTKAD